VLREQLTDRVLVCGKGQVANVDLAHLMLSREMARSTVPA
jgi:hypothetical protein